MLKPLFAIVVKGAIKTTNASVELKQTRHSHSTQSPAQVSRGFYRGYRDGKKVRTLLVWLYF